MSEELTLAEIAAAAGVTRPAASNWRRRYADFPSPSESRGREVFDPIAVARWLDQRKVAATELHEDEVAGTTYGIRFRKSLALQQRGAPISPALGESLWSVLDGVRGRLDRSALADIVLGLIVLKHREPVLWQDVIGSVGIERLGLSRQDFFTASARATISSLEPRQMEAIATAVDRLSTSPQDSGEHPAGDAANLFSSVLTELAEADNKRGGEFYTPRSVARLMVQMLEPAETDRIVDPCCGAGGLLAETADYLIGEGVPPDRISLAGSALAEQAHMLASMNLRIRGTEPYIDRNGLSTLQAGTAPGKASVVLSNPPFNMSNWTDDPTHGHWQFGVPPKHNANFAWLQLAVSMLDPGGRAAVIISNSAAFSESGQERQIRAAMVEAGTISAIIALPPRLFAETSIPVTLWMLKPPCGEPAEILFIDATEHGTAIDRTRNTLQVATADRIATAVHTWLDNAGVDESPDFAIAVSADELKQAAYRLNPRMWVKAPSLTTNAGGALKTALTLRQQLNAARDVAAETDRLAEQSISSLLALAEAPQDLWASYPLAQICEIVSGWAHKATGEESGEGTVHVVAPKNLKGQRIVGSTAVAVSGQTMRSLARHQLQPGDIVFARTGDVGKLAIAEHANSGWVISTSCIRIRPTSAVDAYYLMSCLTHPAIRDWIYRRASTSTVPSVSSAVLASLPIPVPPIETQHQLSQSIRALDEQAERHERLAETTKELRDTLLPVVIKGPEA